MKSSKFTIFLWSIFLLVFFASIGTSIYFWFFLTKEYKRDAAYFEEQSRSIERKVVNLKNRFKSFKSAMDRLEKKINEYDDSR